MEEKISKVIIDQKQVSVRIPIKFSRILKLTNKDQIKWILDKSKLNIELIRGK